MTIALRFALRLEALVPWVISSVVEADPNQPSNATVNNNKSLWKYDFIKKLALYVSISNSHQHPPNERSKIWSWNIWSGRDEGYTKWMNMVHAWHGWNSQNNNLYFPNNVSSSSVFAVHWNRWSVTLPTLFKLPLQTLTNFYI